MLCLKKRRTYSFTQGTCVDLPRRSKKDAARYEGSLNMAITTLPRKNRSREERPSRMVLTVTEDTPADMLAGSMELLVQLPREHHLHTQRVTVQRSTPMMDLLVQIATAHKLAASSYTLQAIGERGLVLPHQPNTPIGALDALQVKLLPKQGTFIPKKVKPANQPFETTFRLQVHLPRNQLYVSRVSPKMNLGEILDEVCREKNLDKHKYELRHPVNLEEILDLSLSLQDYHLQEVTLYAKQGRTLGSALSSQDIMALQRQEERRRQQAKQSVFGFMFKKSKESSVSTDSLEGRSVSPARSDETGRSASPLQAPTRPQRKRRPAPKPPVSSYTSSNQDQQGTAISDTTPTTTGTTTMSSTESSKEKILIGHSRNSSDSSGYHEASVLSDNPDSAARLPETLPRRSKAPGSNDIPRKLAHTSHSSKSLGNLAATAGVSGAASLDRALSSSSLSSTALRKKRAAPPPPVSRPLSSAISTQALERIDDSEESLTSDMDPSKPPSDIGVPSKASSDIEDHRLNKANSDIGISTCPKIETVVNDANDQETKMKNEKCLDDKNSIVNMDVAKVEDPTTMKVGNARVDVIKREIPVERSAMEESLVPLPKPRKVIQAEERPSAMVPPVPKRRIVPPVVLPRSISKDSVELSPKTYITNPYEDVTLTSSSLSSLSSSVGIEFTTIDSSKMNEYRENSNEDSKINEKSLHKVSLDETKSIDSSSSSFSGGLQFAEFTTIDSSKMNEYRENSNEDSKINEKSFHKVSLDETKSIDSSSSSFSGGLQFTVKETTTMNENHQQKDTKEESKINEKSIERIPSIDKSSMGARVGARLRRKLSKKHTKSMNDIYTALSSELNYKTSCTVISTIPKCDRFEIHTRHAPRSSSCGRISDDSKADSLNDFERNLDELSIKDNASVFESTSNSSSSKSSKRFKVYRSPSDLNDFEVDSFNRQKRHLTSKSEDIMFALNMNLMLSDEKRFDVETERGQVEGAVEIDGISDGEKKPLDTDTLLHKVSETLSSSSLVSSKEKPTIIVDHVENTIPMQQSKNSEKQSTNGEEKMTNAQNSSTLSQQQDTSDYVSALDDDLSVVDWQYQLPAPPSAFRDSNSPVFDGYDTVTLGSVEAFKEPADRFETNIEETHEIERKVERMEKGRSKIVEPTAMKLTKEVISELETKMSISTLPRSQKESETKKIGNGNLVTPNIAPIDNHLSNFTITTYTRQKSLDIFDETGPNSPKKNSDETFNNGVPIEMKTSQKGDKQLLLLEKPISQNKRAEPKIISKEFDSTQGWQSVNGVYEKTNVQRSKSHASTMNKPKLKNEMQDYTIERRHENSVDTVDDVVKKSTSITNLNHVDHPRGNEKFSQWRDNILKRQEEPTKEKQLQSLQVLKSILPQLTNTQRADENVSKEEESMTREKPRSETTSNDNSLGPNVLSTNGEFHVTARQEDKNNASQKENITKRYTYNGPPAISLGSWAERPTVKVQIKMDTDYKLGRDNVTGATTIVNLNGPKETNDTNYTKNSSKVIGKTVYKKDFLEEERKNERINERKEHDDLTRKLITHTTASGFKKPSLNKVESKNEDRPIVTAVELKKTNIHQKQEVQQRDDKNESTIDTTPLNFKELTKAFGQDINFRIKPQRANVNRHSDYYGSQLDVIRKSIEQNNKQQNGHAKSDEFPFKANVLQKDHTFVNGERSNSNNSDGKKFTSIVGINSNQGYQNQNTQKNNVSFKNNVNNFKAKVPMPVVKGFKVTTPFTETKNTKDIGGTSNQNSSLTRNETNKVETQPPKPPTMPVIMGVTLKSANARPKSTPVHIESRDMLLESIRNFGGREKLRNTSERY